MSQSPDSAARRPAPNRWISRFRDGTLALASLLCGGALVVQLGFENNPTRQSWIEGVTVLAAVVLALELGVGAWAAPRTRRYLRQRWLVLVLLGAWFVQLAVVRQAWFGAHASLTGTALGGALQAYVVGLQVWLGLALLGEAGRINRRLARLRVRPGRIVVLLFLGLVFTGTLLLRLPRATPEGVDLGWLECLFTATSAVCVTGLTVIDLSRDLTPLGQGIVLVLIQLGGLGIMALTGFLAVTFGPGLGIRERMLLADLVQQDVVSQVARALRLLVAITLGLEGLGVVLLWEPMHRLGPEAGAWHAVFHSVSSFCNAGFSTFSDNLAGARGDLLVNGTVALLVALGSVGVPSLVATVAWWRMRAKRRQVPLAVGLRLTWMASGILWVGGAVALLLLDRGGSLDQLEGAQRWMAALFHSVSARTAGFNTIEVGGLAPAALLLLMFFMFVGGAPGGTAGGIKVTTFSVLLANVRALLRGDSQVLVFGRAVDEQNVREALALALLAGMAVILGLGILLVVEDASFLDLGFETVSALGTTGLSTGVTAGLSDAGRWVIIVLMFVGRVGPLTAALAVAAQTRSHTQRPRQRVPVG